MNSLKSINHIIRSQRPGGVSISFPGEPLAQNTGFAMDPLIMAWEYLGYTELEDQLDEFTNGAKSLPALHVQAHRFATFGRVFHFYYKSELSNLTLDLIGNESGIVDHETNRALQSIQEIESSAVVDYDSAIEINLAPGFETNLGGQFEAFIDGCNNGVGGQN